MSNPAEDPQTQTASAGVDESSRFFLGARSALKIGDMTAAERLLRRALELSPENYNYMLALARLLVQVDKHIEETEELLFKASCINITAVEPRLIMAALYEKLGRADETCAILRSVLNLDPTNFIARRKANQLNFAVPIETEAQDLRKELLINLEYNDRAPSGPLTPLVPEPITVPSRVTTILDSNELPPLAATFEDVDLDVVGQSTLSYLAIPNMANWGVGVEEENDLETDLAKELSPSTTQQTFAASSASINSAIAAAVKEEIETRMPPFPAELDGPKLHRSQPNIEFDELGLPIPVALVTLNVKKVVQIIEGFYYAVADEVGDETALLLLSRAKLHIESIYPILDSFEVSEEKARTIIGFLSNDTFITVRSLEAVATWMYLYITMLAETALHPDARVRVLKRSMPMGNNPEEEQFYQLFSSIQI